MDVTSARYIELFTAGEDIAEDDIVCIKPEVTDYYPTSTTYGDAYVYNKIGYQDTNYGSETDDMRVGLDADENDYTSFVKFDLGDLPTTGRILKAELKLYVNIINGSMDYLTISRVSGADWAENTITYNNKPATTDDIDDYGSENSKALTTGWITFDVTQFVRHWKGTDINNYGFQISALGSASSNAILGTREGTVKKPTLRVWSTRTTDGKIYKADVSDYETCRNITGKALATISTDASGKVQTAGRVYKAGLDGGNVYLGTIAGGAKESTAGAERVIMLGKCVAATYFMWQPQVTDILIEKANVVGGNLGITKFYASNDTRYARIIVGTANQPELYVFIVPRASLEKNDRLIHAVGGDLILDVSWGNNYIEFTTFGESFILKDVHFYT